MTSFKTPFDLSFEDKIIGGKITLRQAVWLGPAVLYFFSKIQNLNVLLSSAQSVIGFLMILTVLLIVGFTMGFITINGLHLDKYLSKKIKFIMRKQIIKHYE